jgi:TRAP-type transport system small permease protein
MILLKKTIDRIDKFIVILSCVALFFLMVLVVANVASRTLFNKPMVGTIEFTGEYLLVVIVYLALSYTYFHQEHIRITLVSDKLPIRVQRIVNIHINIICIILLVIISVVNFQEGIEYFERGINSKSSLGYPLFPALFIISIGVFIFALRMFLELIELLQRKTDGIKIE